MALQGSSWATLWGPGHAGQQNAWTRVGQRVLCFCAQDQLREADMGVLCQAEEWLGGAACVRRAGWVEVGWGGVGRACAETKMHPFMTPLDSWIWHWRAEKTYGHLLTVFQTSCFILLHLACPAVHTCKNTQK